jgi:CRP-like cAMP-binding protein
MLYGRDTGGFATTTAPEGFDLEDFEEVGLKAVERRFGPKDMIFAPGDPDDQLYFVLSGTVRLYKIYGDYKEEVMSEFQRDGHIETRNRRIAILDRAALMEACSIPAGLSVDGQVRI